MKKWLLIATLISSFYPIIAMEAFDYIRQDEKSNELQKEADFRNVGSFEGWPIVQPENSDQTNNKNNNAARLNLLRRSSRLKAQQQTQ